MIFNFSGNKSVSALLILLVIGLAPFHSTAQDKYSQKSWQLMDLSTDSVYGTSTIKAYNELLKGKKSHRVIVAVIDAGVDTAHEDLKSVIWTNQKEIVGNGKDDDHNGYADDIHGWNYLGGKDGRNINSESLESYREYYRLHRLFGNTTDSSQVDKIDRAEFRDWLEIRKQHIDDSMQTMATIVRLTNFLKNLKRTDSTWKSILHKDTVYVPDIKTALTKDTSDINADTLGRKVIRTYALRHFPDNMSLADLYNKADQSLTSQQDRLNEYAVNPNAKRFDIVKDDPFDINDKDYGNNNVAAEEPVHGTHVAGIIAAERNNGIGMDGIADNVSIMALRVVPDGDERDKDIALAIRYAADNGAEVINMSFGKPYSPGKRWIDDAVKYADSKGVLLVHAAGNDSKDLDSGANFPSAVYLNSNDVAPNIITVGASTGGPDSMLVADFSNYGHKRVDVFAPGQNIYSTIPGNKYASFSGTSMACPVTAGIAALILEYYPSLSAEQVKYVIENSVVKYPDAMVKIPGTNTKISFSQLSATGGIVNAYNALKLAATLKGTRKM